MLQILLQEQYADDVIGAIIIKDTIEETLESINQALGEHFDIQDEDFSIDEEHLESLKEFIEKTKNQLFGFGDKFTLQYRNFDDENYEVTIEYSQLWAY